MKRMLKRGRGIMVVDFPLLFETRMEGEFDKVVVVYAQRSHQLHRLRRKGMEAKDALCRINAQLPMQKKLSKAHYIIDNRRAYSFLKAQAHTLYRKLLRCLQ
jgi:dephospho-CoA kinase